MDDSNAVLLNKYIEKLNEHLVEATKQKVVSEARSSLMEDQIKVLNEALSQLQQEGDERAVELDKVREELKEANRLLYETRSTLHEKSAQHGRIVSALNQELEIARAAPKQPVIIEHRKEVINPHAQIATPTKVARKKRSSAPAK